MEQVDLRNIQNEGTEMPLELRPCLLDLFSATSSSILSEPASFFSLQTAP